MLFYNSNTVKNKDNKIITLQVDAKSALPVYEQIKRAIKLAILSGHLEEGEQLMSIRELALKLQVNPNTIIKVYYQLEVEGFIYSRPGAGYYVKLDRKKIQKEKSELFRNVTNDYVSKVLALGYSIEDTIKELSRKISQNN
jgi:GntR family transcriptional regulator